jgi:hypothetical protein
MVKNNRRPVCSFETVGFEFQSSQSESETVRPSPGKYLFQRASGDLLYYDWTHNFVSTRFQALSDDDTTMVLAADEKYKHSRNCTMSYYSAREVEGWFLDSFHEESYAEDNAHFLDYDDEESSDDADEDNLHLIPVSKMSWITTKRFPNTTRH